MQTRDALRTSLGLTQKSARLLSAITPRGFLIDWRELDNKIEAFRLFQYADSELPGPGGDVFRSIWVLEGAGHMAGLASGFDAKGLLRDQKAAHLPETAMIPLHAGMGTAFAEKLFDGLGSNPSALEVDSTVRRFVDICGANCRPGWEDACVEPLGLVVRCLHPHLLNRVSATMTALGARWRKLLWHGVGRGLYFVPTNVMPVSGARERMLKAVARETVNTEDRQNALSGLIWAVVLVNLNYPAATQSLAEACSELRFQDEFSNGMTSALMAWRHMSPLDSKYLAPYLSGADSGIARDWIETPARLALENIYPGLQRRNRVPALYTYRPYSELLALSMTEADGASG